MNKHEIKQIKPIAETSREDSNELDFEIKRKTLNEKCVKAYVVSQRNKTSSEDTLTIEYIDKVILYGYIVVYYLFIKQIIIFSNSQFDLNKIFASSFSLGPFFFFIFNLFDLRIDAKRLLWLYRRPVGYRAQDIGNEK